VFPNDAPVAGLMMAVVVEARDESAVTGRRCLSQESKAKFYAELPIDTAVREPLLAVTV